MRRARASVTPFCHLALQNVWGVSPPAWIGWDRIVGTNPAKRAVGAVEHPRKVAGGDLEA